MAGRPLKFSDAQVIEAIADSGGIVSVIARRLKVSWLTVREYINRSPAIKAAWESERETVLDDAESVLMQNIRLARAEQLSEQRQVDASDAKWMLSKLGKHRGYGDKVEVEQGGEVVIRVVYETGNSPAPDATPEAG